MEKLNERKEHSQQPQKLDGQITNITPIDFQPREDDVDLAEHIRPASIPDPQVPGPKDDPLILENSLVKENFVDATIITIQRPPKLLEKPGPDTWFRTHYEPAQHPEIQVIVDSRQGIRKKWYVVSPSLRHHFSAHILKRTLYRCMDVYGVEFYFHAKSQESGELDQWNKDKHTAAETAKTRWTLLTLKPGGQGYEIHFADDPNAPEPKWSKRTREESFRLLFADAQITSLDHPYAKYLLGKQIL